MSIRTDRVARMLQREIADILSKEFSDQLKPLITVTGVRVTNDLSIASVYVSVLGDTAESQKAAVGHLKELSVRIRASLARRTRHQLKAVPELRIFLDETLADAARLDELFGQIREQQEGMDTLS